MSGVFSRFEWIVAWRYLRARRRDGFISVIAGFSFLGIMLGVATLIVVMAVMNGFRQELMGKILGVNGHAFIQPYGDALTDYEGIAARVAKAKGVTLAAPIVEGQVLAASPGSTSGALVRGVREADLRRFSSIANNIIDGSLDGFDGSEKIAIGRRLAGFLGLGIGDKLRLLSPKGPSTPFGSAPRQKAYEIGAIFEIGMSEFDSSFIFMPLKEAQLYFDMEGQAALIEVFVENADRMDDVLPAIREAVGKPHALTDWRFRNRTFFGALEVERNVMFLILTLIVLVAALNIISGLTMLVKDKARGIAILRTMGATRRSILMIFVIAGAAIGVGGTFFGFLLGVLITWNVESLRQFVSWVSGSQIFPPELYFLSRLPADMRPAEVVAIVVMALTLSLLATLYPAWRAAKLDPVEALRGE
ncbi:lipoprotein-releasing ABC transporter permease subunit [Rhabdaerophilum calidifontis]|uniref:lipoprotein-releasing ABC transporter permease subunit n=1 Tax=Rhabdaerophilum calidifontis TaxID=2604328 RepID=UPI00123ADE38|nr:lipoprotein-releasing ABC transporter permease subunit [Rhabdaerophilum calidifontis]